MLISIVIAESQQRTLVLLYRKIAAKLTISISV
jgi:hypothetical protein